jgi:molecular chaperone GrpE (heat shock protein)
LVRYLESQGVTPFISVGQEVDPDRHDVLSQADGEDGKIVSEFEK